mmetsp:Transcript_8219/g.34328  ORF Transcript_8219/g.34328 Transcript_8219/m.34328 type:complete len:327 (-) Transcript_8219:206-1186(-)
MARSRNASISAARRRPTTAFGARPFAAPPLAPAMRLAKICACLFPAPLLPAILCPDSATGTAFAPLPPLLRFSVMVGGASATSPKVGAPARPPLLASDATPMNASPSSRAAFAALRASLLRSRSDLYLRLPLRPSASSSASASFAAAASATTALFFCFGCFFFECAASSNATSSATPAPPSPWSGRSHVCVVSSSVSDSPAPPESSRVSRSSPFFRSAASSSPRSSSEPSKPRATRARLSRLSRCSFARLVASMNRRNDEGAFSSSSRDTWPSMSSIFGSRNDPVFLSNTFAFSFSFWRRRAPLPLPPMPPMTTRRYLVGANGSRP